MSSPIHAINCRLNMRVTLAAPQAPPIGSIEGVMENSARGSLRLGNDFSVDKALRFFVHWMQDNVRTCLQSIVVQSLHLKAERKSMNCTISYLPRKWLLGLMGQMSLEGVRGVKNLRILVPPAAMLFGLILSAEGKPESQPYNVGISVSAISSANIGDCFGGGDNPAPAYPGAFEFLSEDDDPGAPYEPAVAVDYTIFGPFSALSLTQCQVAVTSISGTVVIPSSSFPQPGQ